MPDDLISVVVVVYNGEKTIAKTITAILRQDFSAELEVIVVDDGSTDRTPEILKTFPQIKFFRQINQGPAAARNKGAELVRGKIIFFTDSDCVPAPDWIKTNLAHYADPSVAVVAGSYDILNKESLLARCIHAEIIFRHQALMPRYPKVFGSYNFSIRKEVFNQVGGFNTDYR
ncbi:MAG TPA: glycosyltransferase family 2 protein, partial [Candidatus Omnitrophota bacterium]|nr:glycosyltransferase family 2 protein [Candidatus Omnitrophota bacterium]